MKFGYSRVSSIYQNLKEQIDALKQEGCNEIFVDNVSGAKADRPELEKLLSRLAKNDVVVVWKLDRLCCSTKHLLELSEKFNEEGVDLVSIQDKIDTTSPTGRFYFTVISGLIELDRDIVRERTQVGLSMARARGKRGGRKKSLTSTQVELLRKMHLNTEIDVKDICSEFNISKATLYRYLKSGSSSDDSKKSGAIKVNKIGSSSDYSESFWMRMTDGFNEKDEMKNLFQHVLKSRPDTVPKIKKEIGIVCGFASETARYARKTWFLKNVLKKMIEENLIQWDGDLAGNVVWKQNS